MAGKLPSASPSSVTVGTGTGGNAERPRPPHPAGRPPRRRHRPRPAGIRSHGHHHPARRHRDNVNQAKGDQDPATWLPTNSRCRYAAEWLAVKIRWRLTVDTAEKNALTTLTNGCTNVTITVTHAI